MPKETTATGFSDDPDDPYIDGPEYVLPQLFISCLPDAEFAKLIDVSVDNPRRRGALQQFKSTFTSHPLRDESRRWTQEKSESSV
ncbi:MAG: hypothetical protein Q9193_002001 [Seirophora villosa]